MRGKITRKLLKELEPSERRYEVVDVDLPGFVLRVTPAGAMTYVCRYRTPDGRAVRYTIGSTKKLSPEQARDEAKRILGAAAVGNDPAQEKRKARAGSLSQYLDETYGPWIMAHMKAGAEQVRRIKSGFHGLLDKHLDEVTAWAVDKRRTERLKAGAGKATINKDTGALKAALSRAVEWGILNENPLRSIKALREDSSPIVRYLDASEQKRLLDALEVRQERARRDRDSYNAWARARRLPERPDLRRVAFTDHLMPMVLLSLHTGMRRGEVFSLQWADVDLGGAMLTVKAETAKAGKQRHIPLNTIALDALRQWREQSAGDGLVFPGRGGKRLDNIKKSWTAVLHDAGIENFRWHDQRHHFASKLVMAGTDLNTVRELLGHGDLKMTVRYSHLAPEQKAEAVAKLVPIPNVVTMPQKGRAKRKA